MGHHTTTQVRLASRPDEQPTRATFEVTSESVDEPDTNEVLVRTRFVSVDPYMAERMRDAWVVGDVIPAPAVGEVVASKSDAFDEGDVVTGNNYLHELGASTYVLAAPSELQAIDTGSVPISTALGVLGMPGRTAYFGTLDVADPKPGETVVVSGAAGAVGSVAGQIATLAGCRVVGIAGSDAKTDWLTDDLGFDAACNYRTSDDLQGDLAAACPDGVDVYFENVGGPVSDAVVDTLATGARIAICGQIAHYNQDPIPSGPRLLPRLHAKNADALDFRIRNFTHRFEEATDWLRSAVEAGDLAYRESVTEGLENTPEAFLGLFEGENIGKQLVRVA